MRSVTAGGEQLFDLIRREYISLFVDRCVGGSVSGVSFPLASFRIAAQQFELPGFRLVRRDWVDRHRVSRQRTRKNGVSPLRVSKEYVFLLLPSGFPPDELAHRVWKSRKGFCDVCAVRSAESVATRGGGLLSISRQSLSSCLTKSSLPAVGLEPTRALPPTRF